MAVFLIVKSRGKAVAQTMLGQGFRGTLISDRWCAYNWVHALKRQVCWAHLVREYEGFVERGGEAKRLGERLLAEVFVLFEWWHLARDGFLNRATFQRKMRPLMREVERLLAEAAQVCPKPVAGTSREILKLKDALWTFVYTEGVEPTNNLAERDLRHAVIWRKTSFGTQSEDGSRFVERILTAVMSLRKQKCNVLDALTASLEAHLLKNPLILISPSESACSAAHRFSEGKLQMRGLLRPISTALLHPRCCPEPESSSRSLSPSPLNAYRTTTPTQDTRAESDSAVRRAILDKNWDRVWFQG
ncbi:transposase [Corallococcus coralloides]|nr:transposase [Corallococcus coralloides]